MQFQYLPEILKLIVLYFLLMYHSEEMCIGIVYNFLYKVGFFFFFTSFGQNSHKVDIYYTYNIIYTKIQV